MAKKQKEQKEQKSDCGCPDCKDECCCCAVCGTCPCECEPVAETQPETRALPEEAGEETSETVLQGGQMMRVVKVGDSVKYVPL